LDGPLAYELRYWRRVSRSMERRENDFTSIARSWKAVIFTFNIVICKNVDTRAKCSFRESSQCTPVCHTRAGFRYIYKIPDGVNVEHRMPHWTSPSNNYIAHTVFKPRSLITSICEFHHSGRIRLLGNSIMHMEKAVYTFFERPPRAE
jgi:hypothetical protein